METTITIIKENAPFAVMLLLAVLYLDSNMDQDHTGIRLDIAGLNERSARVESKLEDMDRRISRVENLLDDMRPPALVTPGVQGMR